jgi:undecaprenyl-diphosphatase
MTARWLAAAAACAVAFVALGMWVAHHPLSRFDVLGSAVRGSNVPLAIVFTTSGYGPALTALGIGTVIAAIGLGLSVKIPIAILGSQILSQTLVNVIKGAFARPRPDAWLYRHELGFSYPSGHAVTAVVFYGAWLVVLANSSLPFPVRIVGASLLAAWGLGIGWSRVALGAHYPTDVCGGFLFGSAWLCAAIAFAASPAAGLVGRHA